MLYVKSIDDLIVSLKAEEAKALSQAERQGAKKIDVVFAKGMRYAYCFAIELAEALKRTLNAEEVKVVEQVTKVWMPKGQLCKYGYHHLDGWCECATACEPRSDTLHPEGL